MRLRMDLAYDGAGFHGWARQDGLRTVQGDLEGALATVLRVESVAVTCAGRTDTGVHARGQVAHVDLEALDQGPDDSARRLDGCCPPTCAYAAWSRPRPASTRASRRCGGATPTGSPTTRRPGDPLTRGYVLAWRRPLDLGAIDRASKDLLGRHDFAAFCKRREGATTIRTLLDLSWDRDGAGVIVGTVRADAFCHHMVRSLVGCLVAVGEGRRPPSGRARCWRRSSATRP